MGALEDAWIENAPNGVGWDDWLSGEYLKPDYWERKRYGGSYKTTEDKLNDANDTIKKLREENKKLHEKIGTLEALKDHYQSIAEYYDPPKKKHKKKKHCKYYSKPNGINETNSSIL